MAGSRVRSKDSGRYDSHVKGQTAHPSMDKVDLSKDSTKPVAGKFKRPPLGQKSGRQRPNAGAS